MPIKLIVAHNLAELRKSRGLTQGELAERFNYSDKSISKWEHGDTMPDIEVLKQLCDFYGVTLDYLVTENEQHHSDMLKEQTRMANKWAIVALSVSAVWLVSVVFFVMGQVLLGEAKWIHVGWICFIWAVPASFIVMLVFNGIWGKSKWRTFLAIGLTWSALACIYITLGLFVENGSGWKLWPIFLIGIPLTIASILWDHVLYKPKNVK
ncbi:MAG: helix-turn-helix transcriptional regulator [Bacilli bacterium]|nr:helix-turn-helix transcriptional regulator [Bacilli bacterium]